MLSYSFNMNSSVTFFSRSFMRPILGYRHSQSQVNSERGEEGSAYFAEISDLPQLHQTGWLFRKLEPLSRLQSVKSVAPLIANLSRYGKRPRRYKNLSIAYLPRTR